MRLYTHTHTHTSVLTNSFFKESPFHSGNGCNHGISLIALIITIIVIIILAAISIAGVSGMVERSRYAKFCGDLDAVQDAVSQAYGTKRIKEAQDPNGLKTSEEIYKWVAVGEDGATLKTTKGPDNQDLYQLENKNNNLGLDLPKYGNSAWGVDPNTGEVFLVDGFEYENHVYYSKTDVQNGGKEKDETGGGAKTPTAVYAKLYNDGTLILSSTDHEVPGHGGVKEGCDYGTDIWYNVTINLEASAPPFYTNCSKLPKWIKYDELYLTASFQAKSVIIDEEIRPTDTSYWFSYFGETELDLTNLDTSFVTDMNSMFFRSKNLETLTGISDWDTKHVTDMSYMFYECSKLATLDLSTWNTENVTDMNYMFCICGTLETLDLSSWDAGSVTSMEKMFSGCSALETLDLSGWNTENVTNMESMFQSCSSLETLDLSDLDTGNVENMGDMFLRCSNLVTLDLSGWDTGNVEDMSLMFSGCSNLATLDLSSWEYFPRTSSGVIWMFQNTTGLKEVYVKTEEIMDFLKSAGTGKNATTQIMVKES